jgi:hypothetical protein
VIRESCTCQYCTALSHNREDASGLRAIRLKSTNVNAFDSVGVEADSEGSVDVDRVESLRNSLVSGGIRK